jgi:hypothetical protein
MSKLHLFLIVMGILAFAVVFAALEAWVFMLLWNWILVGLFNAPTISFWLAWGVLILINILTKAIRSTVTINK